MQKLLAAFLVLPFLFSCREQLNPDAVQSFQYSLDRANEFIADDNGMIRRQLNESVNDPQTHAKAIIWASKADSIQQYSSQIAKRIDGFKKTLGIYLKGDAADTRSDVDQEWKGVYSQLLNFCERIRAFADTLPSKAKQDLIRLGNQAGWLLRIYQDSIYAKPVTYGAWAKLPTEITDPYLEIASLSRLQNDLLVATNKLLSYCYKQVQLPPEEPAMLVPLIAANRSSLRSGQRLEVSAGLASCKKGGNLKVTINNREITAGENGIFRYRFAAAGLPGKYKIPIVVEYTRPDGVIARMSKQFEYTIVQ